MCGNRRSRVTLVTNNDVRNKVEFSNNSGTRKDFILTRHIYIIVWSVVLLMLYHLIYVTPIIYVVTQKNMSNSHREILREFCVLCGTFGPMVNSTMFAMPLVKGKLNISINGNRITERER